MDTASNAVAALTLPEWQMLAAVLPGGAGQADIQLREKLFKELVVRAGALPENKFKPKSAAWKGTLKLGDLPVPLAVALGSKGLSKRCIDLVLSVHEQALASAEQFVNSVSTSTIQSVDMNQFHALVVYIATYFSLSKAMLHLGCSDTIDLQSFQQLLAMLSSSGLGIPWIEVGTFTSWRADPQAAFDVLTGGMGRAPFKTLLDRLARDAIEALVVNHPSGQSCRQRAFQLLQALNNLPSMPNSVPGPMPMSARNDPGSARQQYFSAEAMRQQNIAQYNTSQKESFPLYQPRLVQPHYAAPGVRETQYDKLARCFPTTETAKQTKIRFTRAGMNTLTPR